MRLASCGIFTLCVLLELASAQTWIAGTPAYRPPSRSGRATKIVTCNAGSRFQTFCTDDDPCVAKKLQMCGFNGIFATIDCGTQYCVENTAGAAICTDSRPSSCNAASAVNFVCTSEGFFPDPSDCHSFYQCLADDTGSVLPFNYKCPKPYVFDPSGPSNRYCRLTNGNEAFCSQVKCGTTKSFENFLMRFSWFPAASGQYVVTCIKDNPSIVTRCPAGTVADLNVIPPSCEFVCNKTAVAAFPADVTKYYECVYDTTSRSWEIQIQECYQNEYFDAKLKTCVEAPPCTNGAFNPPKCNTCGGNKAFIDGACTDCGKQILDPTTKTCVACPTNAEYDTTFRGCACTATGYAIDSSVSPAVCKTCPSVAPINNTAKKCICTNNAIDPFASDPCKKCSDGSAPTGSSVCPSTA